MKEHRGGGAGGEKKRKVATNPFGAKRGTAKKRGGKKNQLLGLKSLERLRGKGSSPGIDGLEKGESFCAY